MKKKSFFLVFLDCKECDVWVRHQLVMCGLDAHRLSMSIEPGALRDFLVT